MKDKQRIELRDKTGEGQGYIFRVLTSEQFGNFNPVFCRYQHKKYLVKSEEGDLSDPFRRDESYLNNLYITVED